MKPPQTLPSPVKIAAEVDAALAAAGLTGPRVYAVRVSNSRYKDVLDMSVISLGDITVYADKGF